MLMSNESTVGRSYDNMFDETKMTSNMQEPEDEDDFM